MCLLMRIDSPKPESDVYRRNLFSSAVCFPPDNLSPVAIFPFSLRREHLYVYANVIYYIMYLSRFAQEKRNKIQSKRTNLTYRSIQASDIIYNSMGRESSRAFPDQLGAVQIYIAIYRAFRK